MNSKPVVYIAFALWSLLCWRWYVCGIKQQCGEAPVNQVAAIEPSAIEPDTLEAAPGDSNLNAVQPADAGKTKTSPASAPSTANVQKQLTPSVSSAQVVEVEDRVLIHFPYNSTRREDDRAINAYLSDLAAYLKSSGARVTLTGHSDGIGDPASNQQISAQRAAHIKNTLVKKGVPAKQIVCRSMGERKPLATNDNPRGRYMNRRVEVRLGSSGK